MKKRILVGVLFMFASLAAVVSASSEEASPTLVKGYLWHVHP